jgi:hypothetical protein
LYLPLSLRLFLLPSRVVSLPANLLVSHPPSHQLSLAGNPLRILQASQQLVHRVCHQANHLNPLLLDLHLVQVLVH